MALTNAQYDSLMREYNNKQMRNHQIVIQREEELYRAVPELSRLDDDVSRLSVESIDRLLNGDAAGSAALKAISASSVKLLSKSMDILWII